MKIEKEYTRMGRYIGKRRKELLLLQAEIAKKMKISRSSLANIEAGRQRIMLLQIIKFEKLLKLPYNFLIDVARKFRK